MLSSTSSTRRSASTATTAVRASAASVTSDSRAAPIAARTRSASSDRSERDPGDAVREVLVQRAGGGDAEPGLPDATEAGDRDQALPGLAHQSGEIGQLALPGDERSRRRGRRTGEPR